MPTRSSPVRVYLEIGKTRTFAIAAEWPGWCRSGQNETAALQALQDYGPRYAQVLKGTRLLFTPADSVSDLGVVGRQSGNVTTDFGAPDRDWPDDHQPITADELKRFRLILQACWRAFDHAVQQATGKSLRKGPRGGGRDLDKIEAHVRDVDLGYLGNFAGRPDAHTVADTVAIRTTILASLERAARGELPARGPRGGLRWTPRYFVRRHAWHVLDHAWEIEDRVDPVSG